MSHLKSRDDVRLQILRGSLWVSYPNEPNAWSRLGRVKHGKWYGYSVLYEHKHRSWLIPMAILDLRRELGIEEARIKADISYAVVKGKRVWAGFALTGGINMKRDVRFVGRQYVGEFDVHALKNNIKRGKYEVFKYDGDRPQFKGVRMLRIPRERMQRRER